MKPLHFYDYRDNYSIYFYNVSALSTFVCNTLVFRVFEYRELYIIASSTRAMNVVGKCVLLIEAMQSFVHRQRDVVVKKKYRKELRSCYAKFVYYNHIRVA